jgi:hypothetical protein
MQFSREREMLTEFRWGNHHASSVMFFQRCGDANAKEFLHEMNYMFARKTLSYGVSASQSVSQSVSPVDCSVIF